VTARVVLLRGINVSGHNRLPMADLRQIAESIGLAEPETYVQSGNMVASTELDETEVTRQLHDAIADRFGLDIPVTSRSADEIADIARSHPYESLGLDDRFLQVAFLDRPPESDVNALIDAADYEPDRFSASGREIYLAYPNGSGRSKLSHALLERRLGTAVTARNWRTVRKLAEMVAGRPR
jgi:uncharacterized protein (DUF1697 family)